MNDDGGVRQPRSPEPRAPASFMVDAYAPAQIAQRVRDVGVTKANLAAWDSIALAVLAGAFIGLGAAFSTITITGSTLGFGMTRVVGGLTFTLGLILVVVAGAELFTGNNLVAMAWASRTVSTRQLVRNWVLVYAGNFVGAVGTALLVLWSGVWRLSDGDVGLTAMRIAEAKCTLGWSEAFFRGVLCNALVCLAVWLSQSARTTTDRILSVIWPITAFVALGFEHSIANMYFIPLGIALRGRFETTAGVDPASALDVGGFVTNLVPVTLGNIVGGTLLVAAVYWFVYLRPKTVPEPNNT